MKRPFFLGLVGLSLVLVTLFAGFVFGRKTRPTSDELRPEERQLALLASAARIRAGIPDLRISLALSRVAKTHAGVMARDKRLHFPDDATLRQHLAKAGYACEAWGMTIDVVEVLDVPAVFDYGMKSEAIRVEVLGQRYGDVGSAVVTDDEGFHYLVLLFGRRK